MRELRRHKRISYRGDVLINEMIKAPGISLSEGGLFVSARHPFAPETMVDLSFPLERETIRTRAKVCHAEGFVGMGLMFIDMQPHHQKELKHYIQGRLDAGAGDRRKVLMVDSDPLKRRVLRGALDRSGYTVIEAADGLEALGLLQEHRFDLVILDLYLHELSGLNVITCIRKSPEWENIPIIVLASKKVPYDIKRARQLGANEALLKANMTPIVLAGLAKRYIRENG